MPVSHIFATHLQYDTSYQGIDARRENLRRALEVPEYYTALAKYREEIEHDPHDVWMRKRER